MVVPVAGQGVYCEISGAWFHLRWCRTPDVKGLGTEALFHKFVPLGFSPFSAILGTAGVFIRIVPHGLSTLWAQQGFFQKKIQIPREYMGNISSKPAICAQTGLAAAKSEGNKSSFQRACT